MTPTPPSAKFSGIRSPEAHFKVVRKRNRVPLSCYPCRNRKKCDRGQPCSNCTKRQGDQSSACSYATPASRKKKQSQNASGPDDMQDRIDRLEGLVLSLMHGGTHVDVSAARPAGNTAKVGQQSTPESCSANIEVDGDFEDSDVEDGLATSLGVLKMDSERIQSMYIGQGHWHTILADIAEVKNFWAAHKKDLEKSYDKIVASQPLTARDGPTFLLGARPASEMELRAELPPKSNVLTLCRRYFDSMDNAAIVIHRPTFYQKLGDHWHNPSTSPVMFVGLLYSILCLAMLSYHKAGDEPLEWKGRSLDLAAEYRLRTVQCLVTGNYTRPTEYTVETMLLYMVGEFSSRWDADLGLWLISSLVVKIAYRMGYHRDAQWFPTITPFQAEMRRRTWALVRLSDIIFSHQVSLPSMVYDHDCDTQLPRNIHDEEFSPDSKALPPARPNTDPTPISYTIAKIKLCLELGNILQAMNRIRNVLHYDEIMRFDARLREIYEELPPHLKMLPLEGSHEPVNLIIARFSVDILYHKVVCLLHRNYVSRARHNSRYTHSRRVAIEASMKTLRHLGTLHRESRPDGRLRSAEWFVTSIATNDFLLPAMLVALDLHYDNMAEKTSERQDANRLLFWTREQRMDMVNTLEMTRNIWKGFADGSMEAVKAYKILEIMLEKIKSPSSDRTWTSPPNVNPTLATDPGQLQPEHTAAMTLGMLSGNVTVPHASITDVLQSPGTSYPAADMAFAVSTSAPGFAIGFGAEAPGLHNTASPLSLFDNMDNGTMDFTATFDWESFENYTQTANWGAYQSFQPFFSGQPDAQQGSNDGSSHSFGNSSASGTGRK